MAVRWLFKQHQTVWLWRALNVDGTIERQSEEFSDFGRAVHDAIRKGFSPSDNHWIVETRHDVTHYESGKPVVSVPKRDRAYPDRRKVSRAGAEAKASKPTPAKSK